MSVFNFRFIYPPNLLHICGRNNKFTFCDSNIFVSNLLLLLFVHCVCTFVFFPQEFPVLNRAFAGPYQKLTNSISQGTAFPTRSQCVQRRLRSICVSAQSDQSLRCPPEDALDPWVPTKSPVTTMIRLRICAV